MLWLGVWLVYLRPAHAAELNRTETALAACAADRDDFRAQASELRTQNEQAGAWLRDARLGWGRCIRGKDSAENASASEVRAANQPPQ